MKQPLIILAGPTASGKTNVSIQLAKKINGEIISADSMQIYKYMDIGTAKVSKEEMDGVKHYLIDELYPDDEYSVAVFKKLATTCIDTILSNKKIPILVGGTGFYINAIVHNTQFTETKVDYNYRSTLKNIVEEKGVLHLHNMLCEVDPESGKSIHKNNIQRVIRALEYYHLTSTTIHQHNLEEKKRPEYYNSSFNILNTDRSLLYENINKRVDLMIKNGLIDEVKWLVNKGYNENLVSMKGIGYREVIPFLSGHKSLEVTKEDIKQNTRNFAKRQLTWFKHQSNGNWIDSQSKKVSDIVDDIIKNSNI